MKMATGSQVQGRADRSTAGRRWRRFAVAAVALTLPACGFATERASAASGDCTGLLEVTCTFSYTGGPQTWTPPSGVTQAAFTLYGAQGGSAYDTGGAGGLGAKVSATLAVRYPLAYQINVGQAGDFGPGAFGGGGSGSGYSVGITKGGAGGGGASDVRGGASGYPLTSRMLVAGGGGGGGNLGRGQSPGTLPGGRGGDAGAAGATDGGFSFFGWTVTGGGGGGAGTISGAGAGGAGATQTGDGCTGVAFTAAGTDGSLGLGGGGDAGGGGGGGYYGGGSGGSGLATPMCAIHTASGGGGGGSSFPATASITNGVPAPDGTPHGEVIISYVRHATTTSIASSASPAVTGQPVTYTATVATAPVGGKVAFSDGGTPISSCQAQLIGPGGTAKCTLTYSTRGTHTIQAAYAGTGAFAPSSSASLTQPVVTATTLSVSSSANPAPVGTPVQLITKVSPSPSGGTVTFSNGSPIPGCTAVPVDGMGMARCTTTFTVARRYTIQATYSGNASFAAGDAPPLLMLAQ